jgi:endonuclease/exonuclease/phosphatase family metal-dependent hydrolase
LNVNGRLAPKYGRCRIALAATIRSLKPDVVCLQEVDSRAQGRWLAGRLKLRFDPRAWRSGGMTILTKKPIDAVRTFRLKDGWYNSLVSVRIRLAGKPVWIASVHLDSRRYRRDERLRNSEIRQILSKFKPSFGILAGDFNSMSHLDAGKIDRYRRGCRSVVRTAIPKPIRRPSNYLSASGWSDTGAGKPVTTWIPAVSSNDSCDFERIDRIYVRPRNRWTVVGRATLGYRDFRGLRGWPAGRDHRLVLADLAYR